MRQNGILMHITSLPSNTGIGTLGKEAYKFVDFLKDSNVGLWQVLPIGCVGAGFSPYQSCSAFAGNPYLIDFDMLCEEGLLTKADYKNLLVKEEASTVDTTTMPSRMEVLRKAFERFKKSNHDAFHAFEYENEIWISNFAMFMAGKDAYGEESWTTWDTPLKKRDSARLWEFKNDRGEDVFFHMFVQYVFYKQWFALKKYANENGVKIIGDVPIYVAQDSADVWVSPELFELDEDLNPINMAGCPPDAFSEDGQMWGNPIYNWARHKQDSYSWWTARMAHALKIYDIVRIDHFRAFADYFSIPKKNGKYEAKNGVWIDGPAMDFFNTLKQKLGNMPLIAEDLGMLDEKVYRLLDEVGYPGMKILEFGFSPDYESSYMPHNHIKNCVVYPGTHDNNTILGWQHEAPKKEIDYCKKYLGIKSDFVDGIIDCALSSVADTAIIQMQDWLGLDESARMNTPSTMGGSNWLWRATSKDFTKKLSTKIKERVKLYCR